MWYALFLALCLFPSYFEPEIINAETRILNIATNQSLNRSPVVSTPGLTFCCNQNKYHL